MRDPQARKRFGSYRARPNSGELSPLLAAKMSCRRRHADVMNVGWLVSATDVIFAGAWGREPMEDSMPARMDRTTLSVGLIASVVGIGMVVASPADARQKYRQQSSYGTQGVYRNTPPGNV